MILREQIKSYVPYNEQEEKDKEMMLKYIDTADGDSNLLNVALKEAKEETGLNNLRVLSNGIFGLQILTVDSHIKRGKFVPSHLHLDCCFLLEADETMN